jgi:hypothetical protein
VTAWKANQRSVVGCFRCPPRKLRLLNRWSACRCRDCRGLATAGALGIVRTGRRISHRNATAAQSGKHPPNIGTSARFKGHHDSNRLGSCALNFRCRRIRIGHTYKNFSFAFVWIPTVGNQHVVKQQQILGLPLENNAFSLECFANIHQCFFLDWFPITTRKEKHRLLIQSESQ